jgi:hypothetical protein
VVASGSGDEPPNADNMNHFLMTIGIVPVGAVWATMGTIGEDGFPLDIQKKDGFIYEGDRNEKMGMDQHRAA